MKVINKYPYLVLFLVSFGIYFQTLFYDITYCDDITILGTQYSRISNINRIDDEFMIGYLDTDYYRPMVNISFVLDAALGSRNPLFYHLSNIIYHTIIAFLMLNLLHKLNFDKLFSLLLTLILVIHPIILNAIAWIPGRNDLLLTLFSLISLNFIIDYFETKKIHYFILSLFGFLLAVLSKETAAVLIIPFLFFSIIKNKNFNKQSIILLISMIGVILVATILRLSAELGTSVNRMGFDVILMNSAVFGEILFKFLFPINITVLPVYSTIYTIIGSFLLILMILIPILIRKGSIILFWGLIWFVVSLAPTIFVTTLNSQEWNQYLECRSYLPLIGLIIYFSELIKIFSKNDQVKQILAKVLIAILIVFAAINIYESRNYKNGITFYESAVADFPDRAFYNELLGNLYYEAGMIEEAEKTYRNMIKANPNYSKNYLKMAEFFNKKNKFDSSAVYAKQSFLIDSNSNAASLMINSFISAKKIDSSIYYLKLIYQDTTKYPEAYLDLLNLLINEKKFDEAIEISKERISKGYKKEIFTDIFYSWTQFFFEQKDNVSVIRTMEKGIEIDPNNPEVLKYLAESYRNAGLNEKSKFYFDKYFKLSKKF